MSVTFVNLHGYPSGPHASDPWSRLLPMISHRSAPTQILSSLSPSRLTGPDISPPLKWCFLPTYMNTQDNNPIHHVLSSKLISTQFAIGNVIHQKGGRAMIIQDPRIKATCPQCGSENVKSTPSVTNFVAWVGRILGVPTVKIYEKRCMECGKEFQVFRK